MVRRLRLLVLNLLTKGVTVRRLRLLVLTLLSEGAMVCLLQLHNEHAEAVGDAAAYDGDDENGDTDEPALAVGVEGDLRPGPTRPHPFQGPRQRRQDGHDDEGGRLVCLR